MERDATSVLQSADWGMRALQGSFPILKDRMIYEERGERGLHYFALFTYLISGLV